jgi:hypothetical protein
MSNGILPSGREESLRCKSLAFTVNKLMTIKSLMMNVMFATKIMKRCIVINKRIVVEIEADSSLPGRLLISYILYQSVNSGHTRHDHHLLKFGKTQSFVWSC